MENCVCTRNGTRVILARAVRMSTTTTSPASPPHRRRRCSRPSLACSVLSLSVASHIPSQKNKYIRTVLLIKTKAVYRVLLGGDGGGARENDARTRDEGL